MFAPGMFVNPAGTTPEDIARKRAEIAAMMPSFGNARYVGEGLGQLFAGIGLGRQQAALDKQEQAGRQSADERLRSVMGMRGTAQPGAFTVLGPMPATPAQSVADDAMAALGKTPTRPYRDAIASIESAGSGDYSAVGPTHPTMGRALGRYQVMEANIGPWSKEALGREVTPEEFLANPQLQDAIFDHKFGGYVQQYGPEGAAQAWFAGPGGVGKMDRRDSLGTSVADYTQKFSGALGNSPQSMAATIPVQDLMALATDPWQPAEVRQQAQAMLDQQQQLNDPAYAMGLERDRLAIQKTQAELAQMGQPQPIETLRERQALASAAGLQPGTPEYQSYMLTGNMAGPGQGTEFGLQPIYGTDAQGNVVVMQLGKDGRAVQTALPEGVTPDLAVKAAETARGTVLGKAEGEAVTGLGGAVAKAEQAIGLIDQIANDPALESITGMIQGNIPAGTPILGGGQAGVDLSVKIEQLQGKVFLEAFEALKGGGAITEVEGQKAEQALARLNRAQSTEAYKKALEELKGIINNGMIRAQERAARAGGNTGGTTGGKTRLRFNPETGMLEPVQ